MPNASELILDSEHRIYHLKLRPEELASTIILVGDPNRVPLVSRHFDTITTKAAHREFVTHTGTLGSLPLSVIGTGIGTDNIDIVINECDALHNYHFDSRTPKNSVQSLTFIRLGTAGGLTPDVEIDDIVFSRYAIGLDNLLHYYRDYQPIAPLQAAWESQHYPSAYSTQAIEHPLLQFSAKTGITLTAPGFYGPQGRCLRAPLRHPDWLDALKQFTFDNHHITNLEMETAGIYGLSSILGHYCYSLSAIVAHRHHGTFSTQSDRAIAHLIEVALDEMASKLGRAVA